MIKREVVPKRALIYMEKENENLKWEEISVEHLAQDQWMDIRKCAYKFPDGTSFEPFYNYSRKDFVVVVPFDVEGKLICVKQYRHGIREVTTEFPAGGIEWSNPEEDGSENSEGIVQRRKDNLKNEDKKEALDAAKRELLEETGCEATEWEHLLTIPEAATLADNYAFVYLAKGCKRVSGQNLDDTEFLNAEKVTVEELEGLIAKGEFQQSVHVMAWLLAKDRI